MQIQVQEWITLQAFKAVRTDVNETWGPQGWIFGHNSKVFVVLKYDLFRIYHKTTKQNLSSFSVAQKQVI